MRPKRFEREIEGLSVSLDGYDWEGCRFKNCEILISQIDFSLIGCHFDGCRLTLSGKAAALANVLQLFSGGSLKIIDKGKFRSG